MDDSYEVLRFPWELFASLCLEVPIGSEATLIGGNSSRWIVVVTARFSPPPMEALAHPTRTFLAVTPDGKADTLLVVEDHGVQVIPPRAFGRAPIRSPFAPVTSSVAHTAGAMFISTGDSLWRISATGHRTAIQFSDRGTISGSDRATQVDAWLSQRKRSLPPAAMPETLLTRVAAMDTTSARLSFGKLALSRRGDVAVVRRDLATLYGKPDSIQVDVIDAGSDAVTGTFKIGASETVLAFDSDRLLTSRSVPPEPGQKSGTQRLVLWQLRR